MLLNFRKLGKGDPLIILHGLYGSGDNWFTIARKLSNRFTIYLIDQRNHGASPHSSEFNYVVLTQDLLDFLEQHNLEQVSIMGHSMGGKVGMRFALQYPHRVKHLIVIDIALRNYAPADNIAQQAIMHQKIIKTLSELDISVNSRSDADKQLGKTIESPAIRRFLLKNLKRNDAGTGFYWQLNLMALADNLEYLLDNVAIGGRQFENPVLVINGNKSGYISQEDHGEFHEYFTNCTILSFNTGHWVHAEEPDRLLEEVKRFLG